MKSRRLQTVLTTTDNFCGAGGTSEGAVAAGVEVVAAANHWDLAIDTHNTNHPETDHYLANLSQSSPAYFPYTTTAWFSPECTNHSLSKGKKRKNLGQTSFLDPSKVDPKEERSRSTMWDVVRFTEYHQYEIIIVENVVDVRHWVMWDAWLQAMKSMGYNYETCYFNSMFFNPVNGMSDYAPQSRDRIYVVFWKKGNKKPNLDFRPWAYCFKCEINIQAVQSWKNPNKRWGRYGKRRQYLYRCPMCAEAVDPYYYGAWNAIDWTIEAPRVGDRQRPLKPRTIDRIKLGLEKCGQQPLIIQTSYSHAKNNRCKPVLEAMYTQTGQQSIGFVVDLAHNKGHIGSLLSPFPTQTTAQSLGFVVSARGGVDGHAASALTDPLPTQTTTNSPFIVELFGKSKAKGIAEPLGCVTAGGVNYAVIEPQPFMVSANSFNPRPRDISEPLPAQTTSNIMAVVMPQPFITSYYNGSNVIHPMDDPVQAVTTRDRHSLVVPDQELSVEDCGFRMLQPHEIQDAMGFREDYVLLGTKREQVKLSGNAVTPPVAEYLYRQCMETLQ